MKPQIAARVFNSILSFVLLLLMLVSTSTFAQSPETLGELNVHLKNTYDSHTIYVEANGQVAGSRDDWYAWTEDYDSRSETIILGFNWQHLDRCSPPGTGSNYIAYGLYTVTIDGHSVSVDFRDGDFQDGSGGSGTDYNSADLHIYFNHNNGYFYKDDACTQLISSYIAIWEDGRKNSGTPVVPVNLTSGTNGCTVTIDGYAYSTYEEKWVKDSNHSLNVSSPQTASGLVYNFSSWSDGGSQSHNVSASLDKFGKVWTANMLFVKPVAVTGIFIPSNWGEPIQINWEKHPNSDVVYKIYRRVSGNVEFLATVNHNDTSYTDDTYTCGGYTNLYYDVRAYHTPSQTYADENWNITAGTINLGKGGGDKKPDLKSQTVKEYSVGCYPNPFNPSTTISFALVENADVKLDIYDMTGRRIASLFDGESNAGIHSVVWNGRDQAGVSVSSGLYFYRFRSVPLNGQKPFVKTGKLILMK